MSFANFTNKMRRALGGGPNRDTDQSFEQARKEFKHESDHVNSIFEALKKRDKNLAKLFLDPESLNKKLTKHLPDDHPLHQYSHQIGAQIENVYNDWIDSNKQYNESVNRCMNMIKSIRDSITARDNLLLSVEQSDQRIKQLREKTSADFNKLNAEEQTNRAKKQAYLTKNYNTLLDIHRFFEEKITLFDDSLMRIQHSQTALFQSLYQAFASCDGQLARPPPAINPITVLLPDGPPNTEDIQAGPEGSIKSGAVSPQNGGGGGGQPQRPARLNNNLYNNNAHRPSPPPPPSAPTGPSSYNSPQPYQPQPSPPQQQYQPPQQQYQPPQQQYQPPQQQYQPPQQQYQPPQQQYQPPQQQYQQPPPPPRPLSLKNVPSSIHDIDIDSSHHQQMYPTPSQYGAPTSPPSHAVNQYQPPARPSPPAQYKPPVPYQPPQPAANNQYQPPQPFTGQRPPFKK
ncbi:hypothetical protein PPL_06971 [Heterostelium album PN500]|uniref:BAR domain-containing protein n=1 Tax=Heterostelium pallidum (strain ATCC 26659 / Pp 5 / PN500) TaxID=670386 RepID=D3BE18_HETP5|nr:hypothetical protein PPL_06971 [Heterostelium album PN500]EFA80149.1 hypothetical protein PPL_06971 [Heterostelium album PN500]|eukprot:XP_020432269.1 hypothetical protein PPL_06971 [Heterostelium album PN500]